MSHRVFKCPSCGQEQDHHFPGIPAEGEVWTCTECDKRHNAQHIHAFSLPPPTAHFSDVKVNELNLLVETSKYPEAEEMVKLIVWLNHRSKPWAEMVERALRTLNEAAAKKE